VPGPPASDNGTSNATFCATLVDEWVRLGLTDAVVCPGSRSTPMAIALVTDGRVAVHVHHDERSGSFMAVGLGRATRRPAIVLTTSGTAAAELHAAVVEADLDHVPLLVLTADRPPRLRGVGAPQTIDQVHLFDGVVRRFIDTELPTDHNRDAWRGVARAAFADSMGQDPGPVHCNLPFDEPLLGEPGALPERVAHVVVEPSGQPTPPVGIHFTERGVIIAGPDIDDPDAVLALAESVGWPVVADPRSGCRVDHPNVIAHADALMREPGPHLDADAILRFGSLPASKVVNQWIGDLDVVHTHIEPTGAINDPQRVVTRSVPMSAGLFCRRFSASIAAAVTDGTWCERWRDADDAADRAIATELADSSVATEPGIARAVVAAVPDGGALVVSSSMPVRDVEWYSARRGGLTVHSNRGANGIDGVVSTAVGVSLSGAPTALLIGDIAFLHDINGLIGLDRRGVDLCIVVVDNDGGGIFSFLPPADVLAHDRFEQLFGTPHGVDLAMLVHAHGIPVLEAADDAAVGLAVAASLMTGGVHVVMARTERSKNVAVHDRINSQALEAARASGWSRA
jgi:2-succinyl-5-enolpyruvyl-6-hydroxy-3-cyclohexene-1-carboxylate synthase